MKILPSTTKQLSITYLMLRVVRIKKITISFLPKLVLCHDCKKFTNLSLIEKASIFIQMKAAYVIFVTRLIPQEINYEIETI